MALFIILVGQVMTLYSDKMLISHWCPTWSKNLGGYLSLIPSSSEPISNRETVLQYFLYKLSTKQKWKHYREDRNTQLSYIDFDMKNCNGSFGKLFFQHPEPLRFTQGRWVKGVQFLNFPLIWKCWQKERKFVSYKIDLHSILCFHTNKHESPIIQGHLISGNVVSLRYLIYKCVMALYLLVNQTISIVKYPLASDGRVRDHVKYLIYATHWGLMIFTLSFCLDAILVLIRHKVQSKMKTYEKRYEVNHCNWSLKISMFLTAISYPWILSVTIVYYAALFKWTWSGTWDSYLDLYVHLIITVISLLDTCVSSRPWSLWHAW